MHCFGWFCTRVCTCFFMFTTSLFFICGPIMQELIVTDPFSRRNIISSLCAFPSNVKFLDIWSLFLPFAFDISQCPMDFKVGCGSFAAGTKDVQHSSESADDAEDGSLAFQEAVSERCGQYYCPRCCTKCNQFAHVDILCAEHIRFVLQHQFHIILGDSLLRTNWLYKTCAVFFS